MGVVLGNRLFVWHGLVWLFMQIRLQGVESDDSESDDSGSDEEPPISLHVVAGGEDNTALSSAREWTGLTEFVESCGLSHREATARGLGAAVVDDLRHATDDELASAGFEQAELLRL